MNNRIKSLIALILMLTWVAVLSFSVCAADAVAPDVVATEAPTSAPTSAPTMAPTSAPTMAPTEAETMAPTAAPTDAYTPDYVEDVTEVYVEEETIPESYVEDDNSYADAYTDENGYYYYDEEEMVNNIDSSAGSISDRTELYDTSDIDEEALKESEWDDITIGVAKKDGDTSDFSAIKENKKSEDDSEWIIYTGVVLIILSLIGIGYFIIATATYKKKLNRLKARESRQRSSSSRARDDYGDYSDYPTQRDYNQHYQRKRYTNSNLSYSERKRMNKANTAEIHLPKSYR